jgi:hypothetical protein
VTAVLSNDVMIVLEGRRRLRWSIAGDSFVLTGLWPDERELANVNRHLDAGRPLLVVLDYEPVDVPAFENEVFDLPPGLDIRRCGGDMLELRVPLLNWLPVDLRRRGLTFAGHAASAMDATPACDLPQLLFDEAARGEQIRFAQRTRSCPRITDQLLREAAASAFEIAAAETRLAA